MSLQAFSGGGARLDASPGVRFRTFRLPPLLGFRRFGPACERESHPPVVSIRGCVRALERQSAQLVAVGEDADSVSRVDPVVVIASSYSYVLGGPLRVSAARRARRFVGR